MSKSSRILIVVDPLQGFDQASILRGSLLAKSLDTGIELLIIHADRNFTDLRVTNPAGWRTARHAVANRHADHLEGFAAILKARGHDVVLSVTFDYPLDDGIVRHALYTQPKFVVKETRQRSRVGRMLFDDTDLRLIRHCPHPLWLARHSSWADGAPVLACVNPAHEADSYAKLDTLLLHYAQELAASLHCDAHVFNAFAPEAGSGIDESDHNTTAGDEYQNQYADRQKRRLERLLEGFSIDKDHIHLDLGYPEKALIQTAGDLNVSVVIMGAVARGYLSRLISGSTPESVLDKIDADLLIIKPGWFECPVDAISHADTGYDPKGQIFQARAGTRPEWAGNK